MSKPAARYRFRFDRSGIAWIVREDMNEAFDKVIGNPAASRNPTFERLTATVEDWTFSDPTLDARPTPE